ncbi:MAG: metalloregulator ArsR/SmtB family transcription factor [bacterium]|nr:metalloregulator ArsR/SmtB family transcription factor [bacterium]
MQLKERQILDHMAALSDPYRCRLLFLLEDRELTVSDLCAVMQLPQSTVSRHLKTLGDRGWVESRPDGPRRLYRATGDGLGESAQKLWELTRDEVLETSWCQSDRRRLESVLARRRSRSQEFFDASGAGWDSLRDDLFGSTFHLAALMALMPGASVVGDLGCGTGTVIETLAPFVRTLIGVDSSDAMIAAASARLRRFDNVELRPGELTALPIDDAVLDMATLMLVLHHLECPEAAIAEASRATKPGGRILIVDMLPHDRAEYRQEMGHVWMGFSREKIERYLSDAGFGETHFVALPPAPEAKGPELFAVSAKKREK